MNPTSIIRPIAVALALLGCVAALPASAASNPTKEVSTAAEHAGYAAKAGATKKTHVHMHHVLNCLVGPDGQGFDAGPGNPCDGMGNGAINDVKSHSMAVKMLTKAAKLDRIGLTVQNHKAAADIASAIQSMLEEAHSKM